MKPTKTIKIIHYLVGDLLEFKVKIPIWLVGLIVLLPLIAYADFVLIGHTTFRGYLFVCTLELLLVWMGFSIASTTFKIKQIGEK